MSKNMLDGGQVIVDYLVREKVPYVFGLCGHGNIGFLDALYERSDEIKTVSVHHESVAGFMADVYYRVGGKPTATFTSCGPGSANLPIALANSYLDSVPFLAVTGNVPTLKEAGVKTADVDLRFWFGLFAPKDVPDAIKAKLDKAVATTLSNPQVRERLANLDIEPAYAPGDSLKTKLENEIANWTKFIDAHGIKPE